MLIESLNIITVANNVDVINHCGINESAIVSTQQRETPMQRIRISIHMKRKVFQTRNRNTGDFVFKNLELDYSNGLKKKKTTSIS